METSLQYITLLTITIRGSDDVVMARQRARQITALLNFDKQGQTRIATVVSEIARNAYQYAGGGKVEYCLTKNSLNSLNSLASFSPSFIVRITDNGPGISNVDEILSGSHISKTGNGLGIIGAKKIMDRFSINVVPGEGTEIIAEMDLPILAPAISSQLLNKITEELARNRPNSVSDEIQQQNQELLQALATISKARDDLEVRVEERTAQLLQEMTERKRMEEWMQQHHQDLAHVERINSMGELASALAHELNQPLAAISAYTHGCVRRLEANNYKSEEIVKIMKLVTEQAERAGEIIHRMKNFAKKGKLSLETVDINILIKDTLTLMQQELKRHRVVINFEIDNDLPNLSLDTIQIQQAITNIIRNAIQAMQEAHITKPKVFISSHMIGDTNTMEINIIDNGPGLSVEDPELILMPNFTTKKSGMGMGLSISRTVIEAHGGKLTAKNNNEGECGAWFQITIPVIQQ
jgi:C4-dicarboxylate-specific signal transduction histidine kinase